MKAAARLVTVIALLGAAGAASAQTVYRWTDKDGQVHYSDQLPPADARNVQEKRTGSENFIETSGPSYALRKAQREFPITLYVTADCQAECKLARDLLGTRGVPFTEVSLANEADIAAFKRIFGDEVLVPSVTVGSQKSRGFEEGAWNRLLDDAGYPKSPGPAARRAGQSATPAR